MNAMHSRVNPRRAVTARALVQRDSVDWAPDAEIRLTFAVARPVHPGSPAGARVAATRVMTFHSCAQRRALLAAALCASLAVSSAADARLATTGQTRVSFTASGPGGLSIVGTSNDLTVGEDGGAVRVTVPLDKLTTGIALRDRHMKEKYLEVATYPNATLVIPRSGLNVPAAGSTADATANGILTLHGKSRPVSVRYVAKHDANAIHVTGSVHVDMNDYGITTPSYLGVSVKPDVDVSIGFDASDNP